MKTSVAWLGEYVDLAGLELKELADGLTMAGLEVEALKDYFAYLAEVRAVKVLEAQPHPQSERLQVCRIAGPGLGSVQVVCGAANVRQGLTVPWAPPGTILPGMPHPLKETEIRGLLSQGMLCSARELGLGDDASGLMELPAGTEAGRSLKEISGRSEWVLEIGITPNRGDALSVLGLAREVSAIFRRPFKKPAFTPREDGPPLSGLVQVSLEAPGHVFRYAVKVVTDVKIGPSPAWLAARLASVGVRAINNVVDISNYVMMELGQPLHTFDLDSVAGRRLVVRPARAGELFTTLDGRERVLNAQHLMICDGLKPVALAGIMGGLNSEIKPETTRVLIESACFNPATIRKGARALGLATEASYRFERGVDPEIALTAAERAAGLLAELAGGRVAKGAIDDYPQPPRLEALDFSPAKCNALLGADFKPAAMFRVLEDLGVAVSRPGQGGRARAVPPSWRPDLSREIDLVEEVARIIGYDKIEATLPAPPAPASPWPETWRLKDVCRRLFEAWGLNESISYSFINEQSLKKLGLPPESPHCRRLVPLLNPMSEEQGVLRTTLLPNLLNAVRHNQYQGLRDIALYELGAVFWAVGPERQPEERLIIGGVMAGSAQPAHWNRPDRAVDFWDVAGLVSDLAKELKCPGRIVPAEPRPAYLMPGRAAALTPEDDPAVVWGHLGCLNPKAARNFGLKEAAGEVYVFLLDGQALLEAPKNNDAYRALPRFPAMEKDLALVFDSRQPAAEVLRAIKGGSYGPLAQADIFDVYEGPPLTEGQKSLAIRLVFQDERRTLTEEEVGGFIDHILKDMEAKFQARLR